MEASVSEAFELKINIGGLVAIPSIKGTIAATEVFDISGTVTPAPVQETYDESYDVQTSLVEDIVLNTKGKLLTDDITINKVPVTEVSNVSGGLTLTIG